MLRALGLGDLLVAVPALRLLRRALPDHHLVLAAPTALAPVVERTGAVDTLWGCARVSDLGGPHPQNRSHGVAINLHGRGPESHAALDALGPARRVGHAAPGWDGPAWVDDPDLPERRRWCDLLAACGLVTAAEAAAGADDLALDPPPARRGPDGPVVVHPGAAHGSKRWPVERFAAVARALAARGHRVVVTGTAEERPRTATVAAAAGARGADQGGRTDLAALLDLVAGARLVVTGDTGVAHVATAYGVASVVLFGPVGPAAWGPPPAGPHVTLTDPSRRRGERFTADPDPALLAVGVADVLDACAHLGA